MDALFPIAETKISWDDVWNILKTKSDQSTAVPAPEEDVDAVFTYNSKKDGDNPETVKKEILALCERMKEGFIDKNKSKWLPVHLVDVPLSDGSKSSYSRFYGAEQIKEWKEEYRESSSSLNLNPRETLLTRVLKETDDESDEKESSLRVFKSLLKIGADPNEPNGNGETPLYLALKLSLYEHAQALIQNSRFTFCRDSSFVYYSEDGLPSLFENQNIFFLILNVKSTKENNEWSLPFWNELLTEKLLSEYVLKDQELSFEDEDEDEDAYSLLHVALELLTSEDQEKLPELDECTAHLEQINFMLKKGVTMEGEGEENKNDMRLTFNTFLYKLFKQYSAVDIGRILELIGECMVLLPDLSPVGTLLTTPYHEMNDLLFMMMERILREERDWKKDESAAVAAVLKTFDILKKNLRVNFNAPDVSGNTLFDYVLFDIEYNYNDEKAANYDIALKALFQNEIDFPYASLTRMKSEGREFQFSLELIKKYRTRPPNEDEEKLLNLFYLSLDHHRVNPASTGKEDEIFIDTESWNGKVEVKMEEESADGWPEIPLKDLLKLYFGSIGQYKIFELLKNSIEKPGSITNGQNAGMMGTLFHIPSTDKLVKYLLNFVAIESKYFSIARMKARSLYGGEALVEAQENAFKNNRRLDYETTLKLVNMGYRALDPRLFDFRPAFKSA